ncbi:uncharacterized protein I303_103893 [Kwoniella dejecticola CBS 10117]|uniref:Uncharacterized protein n=1 Tax=Kwoniella dejecticola CBS 10117 TaxID=1296121 RepID=A0A1A6A811_9TREE|nr:uncharacterized protein I303_03912 [Kwoniella dejecticola CBS 10117]OBR86192.1 hypothetical protein I303_03912 [Kwoniella dejecticola CBS 10117]
MGNKLSSLAPWRKKNQTHSVTFVYGGLVEPESFLELLQVNKDYIKAGRPTAFVRREEGTIITFQQLKPFRTTDEDRLERAVMELLGLNGTNGTRKPPISTV